MRSKKINFIKIKFIASFLLLLLISGCEGDFNTVVDSQVNDIKIVSVNNLNSVKFNPTDSLLTFSIKFSNIKGLQSISINIYSPSNNIINNSPITLFDDGNISLHNDTTGNDLIYSNKYPFSSSFANGSYNVEFLITTTDNQNKKIAFQNFIYDNGQKNIAPIISNDIVNPDSITVTGKVVILTSVKVTDPNGLNDINKVYFIVIRPDGTTSNNQNAMFDDGNVSANGDQISGDGIYSKLIQVNQITPKGTYILKFQARDQFGKLSNTISHNLIVK